VEVKCYEVIMGVVAPVVVGTKDLLDLLDIEKD
jgi:hypothetical protein